MRFAVGSWYREAGRGHHITGWWDVVRVKMQFYSFGNWQLDPNSRLCPGSVDHAAFFLSGALQCSAAARNVTSQLYICVSDNAIIVRSTMHDTAHSLAVLSWLQGWPQSDQWSVTRCRHDHGAAAVFRYLSPARGGVLSQNARPAATVMRFWWDRGWYSLTYQ